MGTLINLEQLSRAMGLSDTSVRKLIREPDFPIDREGSNGVEYQFDVEKVRNWDAARKLREFKERCESEQAVEQLKLDLLGGTSIDADRLKLSPKDQKSVLEAELTAMKLAEQRGELVRAAEMAEAISNAFTMLRTAILDVPPRIGERFALSTECEAALATQLAAALRMSAARLKATTPGAAVDPASGEFFYDGGSGMSVEPNDGGRPASVDLAERMARVLAGSDEDRERFYTAALSDVIDRLRALPKAVGLQLDLSDEAAADFEAGVEREIAALVARIAGANEN